MRFQEYYESPVFRGKAFSVDEFATWYASEHGSFTYHQDWTGFNIPSWVLEPFKKGDFNPLTEKEKNLVSFFRNIPGDYYIIGATQQDKECADTIKHEFVHGAFFADKRYREDVANCIKIHRPSVAKTALKKMGYSDGVLEDEINAYLLTGHQVFEENLCLNEGRRLCDMFDKVFFKYFGFSMMSANADMVASKTERIVI